MQLSTIIPLTTVLFLPLINAQLSLDKIIGTSGCAANTEFATCMSDSVSKEKDCTADAGSDSKDKDACTCAGSAERLNCFGSSCWNKVYSCEYQALVALYLTCPDASISDSIPFWPSPTDAPGGCSCNTGQVAQAVYGAANRTTDCVKDAAKDSLRTLKDKTLGCGCCTASVSLSSFANICPDTDPSLIGLSSLTSQLTSKFSWDTCTESLETYDCVKDLKFVAPADGGKLYKPSDLPAAGTKTISNTPGEVTAPVSATYSWTAAGNEYTVTALPNGGGSATGAGATPTPTNAAGSRAVEMGVMGGALVVALGIMV